MESAEHDRRCYEKVFGRSHERHILDLVDIQIWQTSICYDRRFCDNFSILAL